MNTGKGEKILQKFQVALTFGSLEMLDILVTSYSDLLRLEV